MRLALRFALFGFAANAALFAYIELTDYALLPPALRVMANIFCPASVLGAYLFFDLNAHSLAMAVAWGFLGLVNAAIYYGIGALVARFIWKSA